MDGTNRLLTRLLALAAVIVAAGVSYAVGEATGMPFEQSVPLGLLLAGVMVVSLQSVLGHGVTDSPVAVAGGVMIFFAAMGTMVTGKQTWPQTNAFLLFAGALVIAGVAIALVRFVITAIAQRIVRPRRTAQRRDLAVSRGWRFEPTAADLPAALGGTEHYVFSIGGTVLASGTRAISEHARAHDVIRGEAGGVEFVVFDYSEPNRLRLPEVTTAWLVRLPHALPMFTSAEVFRDTPGDPTSRFDLFDVDGSTAKAATDIEFARAVTTSEIVAFTRERMPSWWVDGTVLASTQRGGHGAAPELLEHNIAAITWLATALSSPRSTGFGRTTGQPERSTQP